MNTASAVALDQSRRERVLILAPLQKDAALASRILKEAGFNPEICASLDILCHEIEKGASAAFITEEALPPSQLDKLIQVLDRQPPWSALPLVILTQQRSTTTPVLRTLTSVSVLRNATLLERPVRVVTLVSTVQAAIEARRQQYEVQHLLQQLETNIHQRDEFLAMLGHELRNPLAAISNAVTLLKHVHSEQYSLLATTQQILERQTQHLTHLLDDLLEVCRVTRGKIQLRRQNLDLSTVVADAVDSVGALIHQHGHRLEVTLPPEPLQLYADPVRLKQILINLLSNAAKYTEPGGYIHLSATLSGDHIDIRVRDTGVGMTADMIEQIFDLFVQDERTLARSEGGLGVGLTIAKRLVELHGGSISAASPGLGQGSEFTVRLPIQQQSDLIMPENNHMLTPADERPTRILIVDDNHDVVRGLKILLETLGYQVHSAYDGAQGLEMARHCHPDIILLDIGLPNIDGYEVARRLRADMAFANTRLIAITGYGGEDNRQQALAAGFDHHLTKPVALETLQNLLNS